MIQVIKKGNYKLIETSQQIKIMYLDNSAYIWLHIRGIGHVLEISHKPHSAEHLLACGNYRIYEVKGEPDLVDQQHLELFVGEGCWQGYLLLTGLPTDNHARTRMVPTKEVISLRKPQYSY